MREMERGVVRTSGQLRDNSAPEREPAKRKRDCLTGSRTRRKVKSCETMHLGQRTRKRFGTSTTGWARTPDWSHNE